MALRFLILINEVTLVFAESRGLLCYLVWTSMDIEMLTPKFGLDLAAGERETCERYDVAILLWLAGNSQF